MTPTHYIGLDVGSTTVKAVVVESSRSGIVWQDYKRHETKQAETVLDFLSRIEEHVALDRSRTKIFITGSGGKKLAEYVGARFVQEVNAVSLAVEKLYPETGSVIELGGQDAKIIIFKEEPGTGRKRKTPSMNDKCAGGTGAVIDKINAKLKIPPNELSQLGYNGIKLHPVAGKCGVFAETDINGLQKQGVPADELMASLFESIVQQNLSVLTRGHTLRPEVLLLGGPNTFIKGMVECWKENIPALWADRSYPLPEGIDPQALIKVPENAEYFAAIGAIEFGQEEADESGTYIGTVKLSQYISVGRDKEKEAASGGRLYDSLDELEQFKEDYRPHVFTPGKLQEGTTFRAYLGIDGGSTSTKGVLLDEKKDVAFKSYQLSNGNPIEDTKQIIQDLHSQVSAQGATLEILGVGTTGYAKDTLKDTIHADVALVETVAHTEAAHHFYDHVDVICDVGGQDIKIIILHDGRVVDFKLNTQCSAGNGYFLQGTAETFGLSVDDYAEHAFRAKTFPEFGYGCAVFMQSDIVDFQRQGWDSQEILAGLAHVLPKNIWLYVSKIQSLPKLGSRFVLQGGTQRNLAAVKAQVDFIRNRFKGLDIEPEIIVHKHTGEAGAIGCAVEAARLHENGRETTFIGMEAVQNIVYKTTRNEETRCHFCKNKCLRTFIDINTGAEDFSIGKESELSYSAGSQRLILATCEKGTVEDAADMRVIAKDLSDRKKQYPNLVERAAREAWLPQKPDAVHSDDPKWVQLLKRNTRNDVRQSRAELRIGIPRALNLYQHNPFFSAYFESLGIPADRIVYSDYTTEEMYKEGSKRGSIDPCFPSKVALSHVHNLLFKKHKNKPLDFIFFPVIDDMPSDLYDVQGTKACPTATGTAESVKAAFTKEEDLFSKHGTKYVNPFLSLGNQRLVARQLFEAMRPILHLSKEENAKAVEQAYRALNQANLKIRNEARAILDDLERDNRIGIVLLARPYHSDPGINHRILEEFQKLGYPVFSQDSLPTDEKTLDQVFGEDVRSGRIQHPMDISDVWKNSYSENTSRKIWAAKFVARHPNLVALELSSFKCGHDAPIYSLVQEIIECSGTPYFSFKDIDENRPAGSIKIRIETIGYFLKRYQEDMQFDLKNRELLEERLAKYEAKLRKALSKPIASRRAEEALITHQVTLPQPESIRYFEK
ncbi:MAG: CoA activase [Ectothiorhodospiraceae bacterium]|nr:CoA activase [Ectothiorhodospiraceae bacterium]